MAFSSNGQISYLVLDSLSSGSKYGLEIIEYISQKTNGGFVMKKPTLYSCLTRMEKKGLVSSSFWGESELGGKRHYYSITQAGRENLAELAKQLDGEDFAQTEPQEVEKTEPAVATVEQTAVEDTEEKPTYLQQDNLFDLVKETPAQQTQEDDEEENDVLENQIDMFNMEPIAQEEPENEQEEEEPVQEAVEEEKDPETERYYQSLLEQGTEQKLEEEEVETEPTQEEKVDDAVLLDENERTSLTLDEEAQNQRIYDTSSELKKYRKKKSFSENQIEMSVVYEKEEDEEIQKARIAELKRSLLNLKGEAPAETQQEAAPQYQPQTVTANYNTLPQYNPIQEVKEEEVEPEEEIHDDGRFITEPRINASEIPVARKIAPTNIEVNIYDDNLPAPKRNSELEPSYKDMMSKLFERRAERQKQPVVTPEHPVDYANAPDTNGNFVDYGSLKRYYQARNIEFKEYKKTTVRRTYNTNMLQLVNSIVLFALAGIASLALLWIVAGTHNLMDSTNFLYYTIPGLFGLYCLYALTKYKCFASKKASLRYNAFTNWMIFLLASLIVLIINIACGMQFETIASYSTSLFLPILALLILFPVNFYTKKFIYRRYSK